MARIYYLDEKLCGEPIEYPCINSGVFDFIFQNADTVNFEFLDTSDSDGLFGYVQLSNDGIWYESGYGSFYLPVSIIFSDHNDFVFPSEFYFVSKIGGKLELRGCYGGRDFKWFSLPKSHFAVDDEKIISKIENTMARLQKLLTQTAKQKPKASGKKEKPLSKAERDGYKRLTELCVFEPKSAEKILAFIKTLKNYDGDDEYLTTLNYFVDFLDDEKLDFIIRLDVKSGISDLKSKLATVLDSNYRLDLGSIAFFDSQKDADYLSESFLGGCDGAIRDYGLQFGFIDTKSDEFMITVHKVSDRQEVQTAMKKMGYGYFDLSKNMEDFGV